MKLPYFPFYGGDFLLKTGELTLAERGAYVTLLIYQWADGSLNSDPNRFPIGCANEWPMIEKYFPVCDDNRRRNPRLEEERAKITNTRKKQIEAGKRGAEKRWGSHSDPIGEPISQPNGKLEPESEPEPKKDAKKKKSAPNGAEFYNSANGKKLWGRSLKAFKLFWDAFNYSKGRAPAIDVWIKLVGNGDDIDEQLAMMIIAGAKQESKERDPATTSPKWAQGWLTERRWEDKQPKAEKQRTAPLAQSETAEEIAEKREDAAEGMADVIKNLAETITDKP